MFVLRCLGSKELNYHWRLDYSYNFPFLRCCVSSNVSSKLATCSPVDLLLSSCKQGIPTWELANAAAATENSSQFLTHPLMLDFTRGGILDLILSPLLCLKDSRVLSWVAAAHADRCGNTTWANVKVNYCCRRKRYVGWWQVTIATTRSLRGEVKLVAPVKRLERLTHKHTHT